MFYEQKGFGTVPGCMQQYCLCALLLLMDQEPDTYVQNCCESDAEVHSDATNTFPDYVALSEYKCALRR